MCDLCGADVTASNQALHAIRCCDYMKEPSGEPHQAAAGDATTGCELAYGHRRGERVYGHRRGDGYPGCYWHHVVSPHTATDGVSA